MYVINQIACLKWDFMRLPFYYYHEHGGKTFCIWRITFEELLQPMDALFFTKERNLINL